MQKINHGSKPFIGKKIVKNTYYTNTSYRKSLIKFDKFNPFWDQNSVFIRPIVLAFCFVIKAVIFLKAYLGPLKSC